MENGPSKNDVSVNTYGREEIKLQSSRDGLTIKCLADDEDVSYPFYRVGNTPVTPRMPLPPQVNLESFSPEKKSKLIRSWNADCHSLEEQLNFAVYWEIVPLIRDLLKANPQLLNKTDALHNACQHGALSMIILLVNEFHFDVNRESAAGSFPIIDALSSGHDDIVAIVDFLITQGTRLDVKSSFFHKTPLECCKSRLRCPVTGILDMKYLPVFRTLIEAQANIHPSPFITTLTTKPALLTELHQILNLKIFKGEELTKFMERNQLGNEVEMLLCAFDELERPSTKSRQSLRP